MKTGLGLVLLLCLSGSAFGSNDLPRFYEVLKDKVYRGGQPTDQGIETLAKGGIRTVLDLRIEDEDRIESEGRLVQNLGMNFISVPLHAVFKPKDRDMNYIESILVDPKFQPVFIHCEQGQDRTGLAIGLFRVFYQHEDPNEAYREMLTYGFHKILIALKHYFQERTGLRTFELEETRNAIIQLSP